MENKDFIIWLAGFFDGEGNINISFPNKVIQIKIQICQNEKNILEKIKQFLSISNKIQTQKTGNYILAITNKYDCYRFIKLIIPYSILKNKQLKIVLEILSELKLNIQDRNKKFLFNKIKELNMERYHYNKRIQSNKYTNKLEKYTK